jgi:hypothetical protein
LAPVLGNVVRCNATSRHGPIFCILQDRNLGRLLGKLGLGLAKRDYGGIALVKLGMRFLCRRLQREKLQEEALDRVNRGVKSNDHGLVAVCHGL